jgi:very-short-patch-repair endonuclease
VDCWSVLLPADQRAARIAATQQRAIRTDQLHAAGLDRNAIGRRLKRGLIRRLWQGVYILGPDAPSYRTLARAGVLTCKDEAVVSCEWAGHFWGLRPEPQLPVEVTRTAGSHRGRKKKVFVHRTILTDPRDHTERLGLPITTPERTILDLAERLSDWDLQTLIADALVRKLVTVDSLKAIVNRAGRRHGAAKLARALTDSPGLTRSQYERLLVRICRAAKLPQPIMNVRLHGYEVDAYFREHGVIVEVNPFSTHGHKRAHDKDTTKIADLTAKGYIVLPFTDTQLTKQPLYVVARLQEALAQSSSSTAGAFARRTSASMPLAGSGREK